MAEVDPRRAKLEAQRAKIRKEAGAPNAYDQSADRHPKTEPYPEFGKKYDQFPGGIQANMPGTKAGAGVTRAKPITSGVSGAEHKEPLTGLFTGHTNLLQAKPYKVKKTKGAAKTEKPKKSSNKLVGQAGAASNRDLPGRTTIVMKPSTKDKSALRAQSKASLADSKRAAAAHKNGPGGGASTVLSHLRGNKSHFKRREK